MAFNRDITDAEIQANGMTACPDKMTGTAAQNKARFDKLVSDVVKAKFNGLIDDLEATSAAGNLGFTAEGFEAATVKAAIEELKEMISDLPLIVDEETTTYGEIMAAVEANREIYIYKDHQIGTAGGGTDHYRFRYMGYNSRATYAPVIEFMFQAGDIYANGTVLDPQESSIPEWAFSFE